MDETVDYRCLTPTKVGRHDRKKNVRGMTGRVNRSGHDRERGSTSFSA